MIGFDVIWIGVCLVYLFQVKKGKGFFYDLVKAGASKKSSFNEAKFRRMQYIQVGICLAFILGLRLYQVLQRS